MGKPRQGGAVFPSPGSSPCLAAAVALGGSRATLPEHRVLPDHRVSSESGAIFVHELKRELFQEAFLTGREDDGGEGQAKGSGDEGVSCSAWVGTG